MSSITVWIYYGFYSSAISQMVYIWIIFFYSISCLVISHLDQFSEPEYQSVRGFLFLTEGFFGETKDKTFSHLTDIFV